MDMIVKNFVKIDLFITGFSPDFARIKGRILEVDNRTRNLIFNSTVKLNLTENIDKMFNGHMFKADVDVLYDGAKIKFYLIQKIYLEEGASKKWHRKYK